jgi:aminopeptidase YwaD
MRTAVGGRIGQHLETLVALAPRRPPGSAANRAATDFVARTLRDAGLHSVELPFRARHWRPGRALLEVDGTITSIKPPPFCPSTSALGPATLAASLAELDAAAPETGAVLVVSGELAGLVFPKAFPFLSIPEQVERIARLEALRPAAVLAVVADDALHEPVFEDPDLAFPYATIPRSLGGTIGYGATVRLEVEASLEEGEGVNVSAGALTGPRAVVCAHIDSKATTSGALDNGGGVALLLALAEAGLERLRPVELVFFNGEDHYAAPGEQAWLAARDLAEVELVVNVDGAGLRGYPAAISTIGAPPALEASVERLVGEGTGLVIGPPWFESDHAIFAMRGIPTIAVTSGAPFELLKRRSHADDEAADLDVGVLGGLASFIRALLAA